jgi:hypothetical protein
MALSQVYTAVIGHVITAARWNNEFGNIYANGTDVAFPLTKAVSLAGFTLTLDGAGVTTLSSTSSQAFILTPGSKSGTPSINGNFFQVAAATFTDSNTAGSGVCAVWNGATVRAPTLAASNTLVTTTDASTVHIEAGPTAGTNETLTNAWALSTGGDVKVGGDLVVRKTDSSRTNTVDTPLIVESVTTGTPDVGIGTGILVRAESQDENPSDVGQLDFTFSDRTTASEDSYCQILLRVAGAALAAAYRFAATTAFRAIFTHANTADRTYTLPDHNLTLGRGTLFAGPSSTGSGSTAAHEGTVTISASQALDGIHYYTNFTLDAGDTVTLDNLSHRLIIVATDTITINGTIDAIGAGGTGAAVGAATTEYGRGMTASGGAAGHSAGVSGSAGANCYVHSILRLAGGAINGGVGVSATGDALSVADPSSIMGGAGGGSTSAGAPGIGGNGGGSVVLIAPKIVLGAASVINTSGTAGGTGGVGKGGGGGGGAGNVYIFCVSYTDSGCTFTLTGGVGGGADAGSSVGGAGGDGIKQINIYA